MNHAEDSIPVEWVSTLARAIDDADKAGAPPRTIAHIAITILRPLIEAQFRDELASIEKERFKYEAARKPQ